MAPSDTGSKKRKRSPTVAASNWTPRKPYQAGDIVGDKYVLRVLLGEGGMGAVWRAHNETLDIDVAVKLIRAEEAQGADGRELGDRLLQEARAAAQLGHPAITRVFDFGKTDHGDPFIVMELLEGEDLAQALARRGRIVATKAVALLMPIVHALAAAHGKGIVHRDLKPENIFLARSEDGRTQPKLVDFGIAKMERGKSNNRLTQTGTMLGSPIYMSPEQARGDDVDHLADVWAVCVVLFEMVTGRPPFEGKNYNALLYSIIADEPPPITAFGAGDEELWALLCRGFQKDPDKRWSGVREFGIELAKWLVARNVQEDVTGASLSAQWLRAQPLPGEVFASMLPPKAGLGAGIRGGHTDSDGTQLTQRRVRDARETITLGAWSVRLPKGMTRRRVASVGVASVLAGVIGITTILLLTPSEAESETTKAKSERVEVAPMPEPPAVPTEASPAPGAPVTDAVPVTDLPPAKAKSGVKAKRRSAPRRRKKPRLKNPFD